jgi:hypothetical protein
MDYKQRHKRLHLLIKRLNSERKRQAKKIDILCNDLIAAQRQFIKRLNTINFTAGFYESIIGSTDLNGLLSSASRLIKEKINDANVSFFLRQAESFELYMFDSNQPVTIEKQRLENYFSPELMEDICKANKVCTIQDMFAMGLQGNLNVLNKISAVTIPLGLSGSARPSEGQGSSMGFILIYRPSENNLTADEINDICAITCGLSRAIAPCQVSLKTAD